MTAPPFSDSTSGELFLTNRCQRCVHWEGHLDQACEDFTPAFLGEWPEILYRVPISSTNPIGVECRKFREEGKAMTSPVPLALRELMILTKCYCDGEHPRLGHNCSFRRDVETVVAAVARVLKICEADTVGDRAGHQVAFDVRRELLGNGNTTPHVSDGGGSPSAPG